MLQMIMDPWYPGRKYFGPLFPVSLKNNKKNLLNKTKNTNKSNLSKPNSPKNNNNNIRKIVGANIVIMEITQWKTE